MTPSVFMSKNNIMIDMPSQKYKENKKTISQYQEFIKKISIMSVKILLMKQDLYITK